LKKFQKTKGLIIIILVLSLAMMLAACDDDENKAGSGDADDPVETTSTKTGVLIEASMHVMSIQAPDGTTYTFGINDNTTVEGSELLGNTMSVTYRGEYTSGVMAITVTTVTEVDHASSDGKGSTSDPGAPQQKDPPGEEESIWYLTGTVTDVSMNQLQLLYEDGTTYTVLKNDDTKTDEGIVVGCIARVFHKGGLKNGMVATEIHFIGAGPSSGQSGSDDDILWYMTGTVTDVTMNELQLLYEDGNTYTIIKDDNTKTDEGITVNATVRIFHKGELQEQMLAVEIKLITPAP